MQTGIFGQLDQLTTEQQNIAFWGNEELQKIPPDVHATNRAISSFALTVFQVLGVLSSFLLIGYGASWGGLKWLIDGQPRSFFIGIGGGITLFMLIRKISQLLDPIRLFGQAPYTEHYEAMSRLQNLDPYEVPAYMSDIIRSANELANVATPPLKSPFEDAIENLSQKGGNTDKKYHSSLSHFLVKARCQIFMNYLFNYAFAPALPHIFDHDSIIERVSIKAREALAAFATHKVPLSIEDERILTRFSEINFLKKLPQGLQRAAHLAKKALPSTRDKQIEFLNAFFVNL